MCGIFGISISDKASFSPKNLRATIKDLFVFSESRGKEAAGLAILDKEHIEVLKSAIPASKMIRTRPYADILNQALKNSFPLNSYASRSPFTLIGHSRLVTTGTQYMPQNNQPVIAGRMIGIHNGIIVNHDVLWNKYPGLHRQYQVDTEIIFCLIRMFYEESRSLLEATRKTFGQLKGTASVAVLFEDFDVLLLTTNNGSLYCCTNTSGNAFIFASERYILYRLIQRPHVKSLVEEDSSIQQIPPGQGYLVNILNLHIEKFQINDTSENSVPLSCVDSPRQVIEHKGIYEKRKSLTVAQKRVGLSDFMDQQTTEYLEHIKRRFLYDTSWQDSLRRCTTCILPETMPFIEFDDDGVCNYCRTYRKLAFKGTDQLAERVEPYRRHTGEPDCVVGISGGRDSLYTLHYVKAVLKMHPVAYTYDWAMVTDLARRNISRICAKLGVEHILVSADISRKRKFIKKNVAAWLKKPELGMIPLFMAGDKQYFYYLQKVRKQLGVELAILGENMLERTDFKTGFADVRPYNVDPQHVYTLPLSSKLGLLWYYGKQYLVNPEYINASLIDTLFAAACYYAIDRRYLNLYNYIPWIEETIIPTLINEYEFELATDSKTTWRIGDGTAAFYNYIYYNVAGFTENETFRSNQIREGLITREEALKRVREENKPRYETIYWYLNIIELDIAMEKVLEIIHTIPKLKPVGKK